MAAIHTASSRPEAGRPPGQGGRHALPRSTSSTAAAIEPRRGQPRPRGGDPRRGRMARPARGSYHRGDPVLHIELPLGRTSSDRPAGRQHPGEAGRGLADNCLTCVWRAWDRAAGGAGAGDEHLDVGAPAHRPPSSSAGGPAGIAETPPQELDELAGWINRCPWVEGCCRRSASGWLVTTWVLGRWRNVRRLGADCKSHGLLSRKRRSCAAGIRCET